MSETVNERLDNARRGSLAYGWPWDGTSRLVLDDEPLRGWLQELPDGMLQYEVLVDDVYEAGVGLEALKAPASVALSTPHGGALLLDVSPRVGSQLNWGGGRASVHRYRASTVLFGVDLDELRSNRLDSVALQFAGLGEWAGLELLQTQTKANADGLVQSATLELLPIATQRLARGLPQSLALEVGGHWETSEQGRGARGVQTALEVRATAKRPRAAAELLRPLLRIQDLLSVLHGGFVPALAAPVGAPDPLTQRPLLWHRDAMHKSRTSVDLPGDPKALLSLADVGGPAGLARWTRLCVEHPTVVDAVVAVYREGPESVETRLLRLGVGIERWVAAHRRGTAWAAKTDKDSTPARSLARFVGEPFAAWVGDGDKWAKEFHASYNAIKHPTEHPRNPELAYWVMSSASWLLTAALLDRAAGTKRPSRTLLRHYRLRETGAAVRSLLGT